MTKEPVRPVLLNIAIGRALTALLGGAGREISWSATLARRSRSFGVIAGVIGALMLAGNPASAAERRLMTADDILRAATLADPQVSPDGAWVAYVVTTNDREADEERSAIWMVSWDGKEHVRLTTPSTTASQPRFSPDGRYLAYLAGGAGSEKTQLQLIDRRGGAPQPVTVAGADVADYAWSPDGKRLALALEMTETDKQPKPIVIDTQHFKRDEDGYLATGHRRQLYLLDVASRRAEALTHDAAFSDDLPTWSPDGEHILFVRDHELGWSEDGRSDIEVIEARAGATARSLAHPFSPNAQKLAWSPDGRWATYLTGRQPRFNAYMQDHLAVVPAGGGVPRGVADALDRAITSYAFTDAGTLTVTIEDDAVAYAARIDLGTGRVTPLRASAADAAGAKSVVESLSAHGGHIAVLRATDTALAEVYALEDGALRKLSEHNDAWLADLQFGAVDDVQFKSRDGAEIHGLLVKPPGFVAGRRYPLLLWIHGGPNGGDQHALALDGYQFEHQYFAARGFLVLRVNYRGVSGRGAAYAEAIVADWGHKEVLDLLAGVDHVVGSGLADPARLAIGGWSYGGILTDYTIATDGRFKAAISGAGSANQLSMYGVDQYALQYNAELGPPWRDTALWLKVSYPFFHADRIHTPTLFLGGEKDFNVPVSGGEQMYQSLRTLGVPARLVVYPEQHHVFTRPSFVKDLAERMAAWIDLYVPAADPR